LTKILLIFDESSTQCPNALRATRFGNPCQRGRYAPPFTCDDRAKKQGFALESRDPEAKSARTRDIVRIKNENTEIPEGKVPSRGLNREPNCRIRTALTKANTGFNHRLGDPNTAENPLELQPAIGIVFSTARRT
jgi:hypothetical protein